MGGVPLVDRPVSSPRKAIAVLIAYCCALMSSSLLRSAVAAGSVRTSAWKSFATARSPVRGSPLRLATKTVPLQGTPRSSVCFSNTVEKPSRA